MSLVPIGRRYAVPKRGDVEHIGLFSRDVDRIFDSFWRNAFESLPAESSRALSLKLNVSETETAYKISAEIPGVDESDVEVTLVDGVLTITGEKKSESEEEGKTFHRIEHSCGTFSRAMTLPADADENAVTAAMKNGVINVEVGKLKEAPKTRRKIDIQKG